MNSADSAPGARPLPDEIRRLIDDAELPPLGPGDQNQDAFDRLQALELDSLADEPIQDPQFAECCLAGLWLRHNYLERSHEYSQSIETAEGSYWHGIMHRREPDFSNAKYWFRRVGDHPVFDALSGAAAHLIDRSGEKDERLKSLSRDWDPFAFVDLCEAAYRGRESEALTQACRELADAEWTLLFEYCHERATR